MKFSAKELDKQVKAKKRAERQINFHLIISMVVLFLGIVGLCLFIKLQDFSVTITFPPAVVAFAVAVVGLSSLYIISKEMRK